MGALSISIKDRTVTWDITDEEAAGLLQLVVQGRGPATREGH